MNELISPRLTQPLVPILGLSLLVWSVQVEASNPYLMQTSVRIEKMSTLAPLQDALRQITKTIGFETMRNGLLPEYKKSFEEYRRFVTEYHKTETTFLVAENINDADCIVIKLYSKDIDKKDALSIEDKINQGISRHFPKGITVYPNGACGGAGEVED